MIPSVVVVLLVTISVQVALNLALHRWLPTETRRGVLCRVKNGPGKGQIVAVAIDRPHTILRLVQGGQPLVAPVVIPESEEGDDDA